MDSTAIGKRLRILRGSRTMEEVAIACGITKSAISNYENGQRIPADDVKQKLAMYYGVTVDELFFAT